MTSKNVRAALALGALFLTPAACSRDDVPTSPQLAQTARFSGAYDLNGDGIVSDAEKKEYDRLMGKDSKGSTTTESTSTTSSTTTTVSGSTEFMKCNPLPTGTVTRRIGPLGGEIKIGPHKLSVPPNALDRYVDITATIPAGSIREVEYAPHGLVFRTDVKMKMSWDGCTPPVDAKIKVVYTGDNNAILAEQPSESNKDMKEVEAWTNHFSGYAVAVGRW